MVKLPKPIDRMTRKARIKYHQKKLVARPELKEEKKHINALAKIGTKEAVDVLFDEGILRYRPESIRFYARALSKIGTKEARDALISGVMGCTRPVSLKEIIKALGKIGDRKSLDTIVKDGLAANDWPYREASKESAKILMKAGEKAFPSLMKYGMLNKGEDVVVTTIKLLEKIPSPDVLPALLEHGLTNDHGEISDSTVDAINRMTQNDVKQIRKYVKHENPKVVKGAVKVIRWMKDKKSVNLILKYGITHKKRSVKQESAETLGKLGDTKSISSLVKYGLRQNNKGLAMTSAKALGEIGTEKAAEALVKYGLTHPSYDVKGISASWLGRMKYKKALVPLMKLTGTLSEKQFRNEEYADMDDLQDDMYNRSVKRAIKKIQDANK